MLEPIYIVLVGRAITTVNDERLPYATTAIGAAKDYLKRFPNLDVRNDVIVDCKIGKGSHDLIKNFEIPAGQVQGRRQRQPLPAGQRHLLRLQLRPLSETETVCLETEQYINGAMKKKLKETGEDVKVMCARNGDKITMTIACAMVDRYIPDADHYTSVVEEMKERVARLRLQVHRLRRDGRRQLRR